MAAPASGPKDWRLIALAAGLGLAAFLLVLGTLPHYGITWDEPNFFAGSQSYARWFELLLKGDQAVLSRAGIERYWGMNWDHPPLARLLSTGTFVLFRTAVGSEAALRLASGFLFALLVAMTAWWTGRTYSRRAGLIAGAAALAMPQLFGHAHFAATDTPLVFFWLLTTLMVAPLLHGRALCWSAGVAGGLLLATKLTGVLLFLALVPVFAARRGAGLGAFVKLVIPALVVGFLLNPLLWHDPVGKLRRQVEFAALREARSPIPTLYFGTVYDFHAPWHYGLVMVLLTIPAATLVLAGAGMVRTIVRRDRVGYLLILQAFFLPLLTILPFTPTYDGARLFLPAFPFWAILAGIGADMVLRRFAVRWQALIIAAALPLMCTGLAFSWPMAHLSAFNEMIGGARGAESAGLEVTYWSEQFNRDSLAYLNAHVPLGGKVHFAGFGASLLHYYRATGQFRRDFRFDNFPRTVAELKAKRYDLQVIYNRGGLLRTLPPTAQPPDPGVTFVTLR